MSYERKPDRLIVSVSFSLHGADIVIKSSDELFLEEVFTAVCDGNIPLVQRPAEAILLETLRKPAEAEGRYIRQTGGSGNYGHVKIRLEPIDLDAGFEFVNAVQMETLPAKFIDPIKQGIVKAMRGGVLHGHEVVGIRATLFDGSYHDADSNETAFQIAASLAFKEAARKSNPVLLEPMMEIDMMVLEARVGAIIGDINSRHGRIESIHPYSGKIEIKAILPLRETLRSSRYGRPDYPMNFARYEPANGSNGDLGDEATGAAVRNPRRPNSGIGSADAELNSDSN